MQYSIKTDKRRRKEEEFIKTRIIPILEKEEQARIKHFQKIYGVKGGNMPK